MSTPRTWDGALDYLYAFCNFEYRALRRGNRNYKLDRIRRIAAALADPQDAVPVIHIAGTKGKGSTAAYLSALLRDAGFSVGTFTSPHLDSERERIAVNGQPITEAAFVDLTREAAAVCDRLFGDYRADAPTTFELFTLMAFRCFAQRRLDVAVMEAGLGGRLDATNIVSRPAVTVITSISYDHQSILGQTQREIAAEKAGILKPSVPLVCGVPPAQREAYTVIQERTDALSCPLIAYERDYRVAQVSLRHDGTDFTYNGPAGRDVYSLRMVGRHQAENAAAAVTAARLFSPEIESAVMCRALPTVQIGARLERRGSLIIDGAHNGASLRALFTTLTELYSRDRFDVLFAARLDKDLERMVEVVSRYANSVYLTAAGSVKDAPVSDLAGRFAPLAVETIADPAPLLGEHRDRGDPLVITGSLYLAARVRRLLG